MLLAPSLRVGGIGKTAFSVSSQLRIKLSAVAVITTFLLSVKFEGICTGVFRAVEENNFYVLI